VVDDDEVHAQAMAETGFWGRRGAGCLVYARSTGRFLVALRSDYVQEPGTWGTWGGAVPEGVDAAASTLRELAEETGCAEVEAMVPAYVFRDEATGFAYENFVAVVEDEFEPVLNWENDGWRWVEQGEWPEPLHFGLDDFLANVPDLRAAVAGVAARRA